MQVDIPAAPYYIEAQPSLMALSRVAPALRHDSAPFEYPIEDLPDSIRDRAHLICAAFVNTHDGTLLVAWPLIVFLRHRMP